MVTEKFCEWAADRLLGELRRGETADGLTPGDFAWHPMSTVLRSRIADTDHLLAKKLVARPETVMWAALLGRAFLDDADLTGTLLARFEREVEIDRLIGLFHHLTARSLTPEQRDELERWVQGHLHAFISDQRAAFADVDGPDRLVARVESDEPGFRAKRWVYMYSALAALGPDQARALLTFHADSDDPVVARSARAALVTADGDP